jgi:drug/metabolite transporter (DMT)-like permease
VVAGLIVLSALLHAAWNAMLRRAPDKDRAVVVAIAIGAAIAMVAAGARWIAGAAPFASLAAVGWTVVAGVIEAVYFAALGRALSLGSLGVVYTISRGGTVPLVWGASVILWSEPVTGAALAGSAIVLAGLVAAGAERGAAPAAVRWATACAVLIAGYHLAYKAALAAGGSPSAVFAVSLSLASVLGLLRLGAAGRRAARALVRARPWHLAATGALCSIAFLVFLEGLALGGAGFALTLRNTSVLFAIGLAWVIGDRPSRRQVVGAALVAVGAVWLVVGDDVIAALRA